jgi:hypothetical protein
MSMNDDVAMGVGSPAGSAGQRRRWLWVLLVVGLALSLVAVPVVSWVVRETVAASKGGGQEGQRA